MADNLRQAEWALIDGCEYRFVESVGSIYDGEPMAVCSGPDGLRRYATTEEWGAGRKNSVLAVVR